MHRTPDLSKLHTQHNRAPNPKYILVGWVSLQVRFVVLSLVKCSCIVQNYTESIECIRNDSFFFFPGHLGTMALLILSYKLSISLHIITCMTCSTWFSLIARYWAISDTGFHCVVPRPSLPPVFSAQIQRGDFVTCCCQVDENRDTQDSAWLLLVIQKFALISAKCIEQQATCTDARLTVSPPVIG